MQPADQLRFIIENAVAAHGVRIDRTVLSSICDTIEDQLDFQKVALDEKHVDGRDDTPFQVREQRAADLDRKVSNFAAETHLTKKVKRSEIDHMGPYYTVRRELSFFTFKIKDWKRNDPS